MPEAGGRREVAELLRRYGVTPRRSLGQHFLVDPNLVAKLVRLTEGQPGDKVLEVGVGTGTLTRALAEAGYQVRAYEVDHRLGPLLSETLGDLPNVDLRFEDALAADLPHSLREGPWTMVSNLPYNVGTPLLLTLLMEAPQVDRMVVMVQREVAERLVASTGTRNYGVPSVVAQLFAEVRAAFHVPPQVFLPPPRVASTVVVLQRSGLPVPEAAGRAVQIAATGFRQRRKMLRSSLRGALGHLESVLSGAGVPLEARAEAVSPQQYLEIARAEAAHAR
ncbi:MAG: 16S rRNA (adenine(1518)-N(6)/adenine(1519)-N(6))-dimethyltransferase RsmA [Actinomycetota bacterium]|nr:16S rRNA (adenine(1518)-N(6)/adenine(1519)-N(6))-dimethyltransferase RsmA [Actinomycetota bacterium]